MKLADWMRERGLRDGDIAARLEVTRTTISRIRREKLTPSAALIARIFELTEGAVPPTEFFAEEVAS